MSVNLWQDKTNTAYCSTKHYISLKQLCEKPEFHCNSCCMCLPMITDNIPYKPAFPWHLLHSAKSCQDQSLTVNWTVNGKITGKMYNCDHFSNTGYNFKKLLLNATTCHWLQPVVIVMPREVPSTFVILTIMRSTSSQIAANCRKD